MSNFVGFLRRVAKKALPDIANYKRRSLSSDIAAGLTVGIVALPLSLALAIATGVPPILGLYTAGIAGFVAALCAGSPYSVSGPAAAMVPILALIIQQHGLPQLPYITILAALFLLTFAMLGIGKFIHKVPESVVLGFTAGVAVVIFVSQLNSFLGLTGIHAHNEFIEKLMQTITHLTTISLPTVIIGVLSLAVIILFPRVPVIGKIPPTLVAIVLAVGLTLTPFFAGVATLGSVYGSLPLGFPDFVLPNLSTKNLSNTSLLWPAFQIAALIAIESLLCAVVADKLTKTKHRSNQELFAQGVGNLSSAMFGGIPSTAVIARTGTIIKSGAKSRLASLLHAVVVLAFIVALAPLASAIPLTALCAVLLVTAYKISEHKEIMRFVRTKSWKLSSVLGITMTLTIFTDLVMGVGAGILLHIIFAAHDHLRGARNQDGSLRLREEEA